MFLQLAHLRVFQSYWIENDPAPPPSPPLELSENSSVLEPSPVPKEFAHNMKFESPLLCEHDNKTGRVARWCHGTHKNVQKEEKLSIPAMDKQSRLKTLI